MFKAEILVGHLKGEIREVDELLADTPYGGGAVILDKGDRLWYGLDEIEFLPEAPEMDCE